MASTYGTIFPLIVVMGQDDEPYMERKHEDEYYIKT